MPIDAQLKQCNNLEAGQLGTNRCIPDTGPCKNIGGWAQLQEGNQKPVHVKYFSTFSLKYDHKCCWKEATNPNTQSSDWWSNTTNMSPEQRKSLSDFLESLCLPEATIGPDFGSDYLSHSTDQHKNKTFPAVKWKRHHNKTRISKALLWE